MRDPRPIPCASPRSLRRLGTACPATFDVIPSASLLPPNSQSSSSCAWGCRSTRSRYFNRILSLYWTVHYLNVYAERSFFQSAEFGTLGWAFPGAPGAVHRGRRRHHADLSGTRDSVQVPHPGDAARGQRSGLRPEPPQHPARRRSGRVRPTPSARPTSSSWRVRWAYPPDAFAAVSSSDGSQLIELPVGPLAAPPRDGYGAEHRNHQACPLTATGIPDPERSTSAA